MTTKTEIVTATSACHEGFDLDICSWNPEAVLRLDSLDGKFVYTFGRVDNGRLRAVTYWNGPGCLFLSSAPEDVAERQGWNSLGGFTTDDPLIRVPLAIAIRYLFVQGYSADLDWRRWVPSQTLCVNDVNGHIRKWHRLNDPGWQKVCEEVFAYVDQAAARFLWIAPRA